VKSLAGPFFAFALLLVVAGAMKALRPGTAVLALRSVGAPVPPVAVRAGGAFEAVLGVCAILVGGRLCALAVGASYAAFAVFVVVAMRRGGVVSSCGCFGRADTPPTPTHIAINLGAAAVSLGAAFGVAPSLASVLATQPLAGLPFLLITAVCGWFGYLIFAVLPTVRRPGATA
jgi:hypothetical protein